MGVYTMDYIYEINEAGELLAVMVREDDGYFQINYFDETAYNENTAIIDFGDTYAYSTVSTIHCDDTDSLVDCIVVLANRGISLHIMQL